MTITTTHGQIEESQLARTVGFEDRPDEFVVWVEWRWTCPGCKVCDEADTLCKPNSEGVALVRRDAHVIKKKLGVVADALAAKIG